MPSQQAEKDAVDTLLFMSSPKNSNRIAYTSVEVQSSPLRTEMMPARRVAFESRSSVHFDFIKPSTRKAQAKPSLEEMEAIESEARPVIEVGK
jgi:hypothetical protein